jgi:phosphoenolpyruvate carboxykinase (GTP)
VLRWIAERCDGRVGAEETPIGYVPRKQDLDLQGLNLDAATLDALLAVDRSIWRKELDAISTYLDEFKGRVPDELRAELQAIAARL